MTISRLRHDWAYLAGRLAALAARPLMLLLANHWAGNAFASTLAMVFLLAMLGMAASGFDTHRAFYRTYFGERQGRGLPASYRNYVATVCLQIGVVATGLVAYLGWRQSDMAFGALAAVYFATERLADESQRFLIFQNRRADWGRKILIKSVAQNVGLLLACLLAPPAHRPSWALIALAAGNLMAYGQHLPWSYLPRTAAAMVAAFHSCRANVSLWLLSGATTLIAYIDRVVVMLYQQSNLAEFTLLVSCMSIVQNAMEYFFLSFRRATILQGKLSLSSFFHSRSMYTIVGGASVVGVVLSWATITLYRGQAIERHELIPIVLVSQICLALSLVVREINYWNFDIRKLTVFESSFIALVLLLVLGSRHLGLDYSTVLGMVSVGLVARVLMLSRLASMGHKAALT